MAQEEVRKLIQDGLQAAQAGSDVAERATSEIQNDAADEELRQMLQRGNSVSQEWKQRITRAIAEAGQGEKTNNKILEAHYEVSQKIRQKAPDAMSRDLGIIAAGQLALHYWIAAFGTLGAYAEMCRMTQTAQEMRRCVDEAKQADQMHTQLAQKITQGSKAMAGAA